MYIYTFPEQLRQGDRGEHALDVVFASDWIITGAIMAEQRQGIDRHFTHRMTGLELTIEYKTDYVAGRTHNAFLETVSVDKPVAKPGWAQTCSADYLFYYIPTDGLVYVLAPGRIRHFVYHLARWCHPVPVPNRDYHTWGFVVPLRSLERCAEDVVLV